MLLFTSLLFSDADMVSKWCQGVKIRTKTHTHKKNYDLEEVLHFRETAQLDFNSLWVHHSERRLSHHMLSFDPLLMWKY